MMTAAMEHSTPFPLAVEPSTTLHTSYLWRFTTPVAQHVVVANPLEARPPQDLIVHIQEGNATGRGILIGMLSAFGSALFVIIVLSLVYLLRYTTRGRILLDRIGRPGEFDDEQAFIKEEAEALDEMDDIQRAEYMRAKAYVQANPPESAQTDISLSQFLAIQEKGVSAWEFEPELEIANCFVEGRTEIEFYDSECSVQSNLPVPKQNDVYYWEAKIYDKPEATTIGIGMTTKPYPLFRLPGYHKTSVAYLSPGHRRFNQPFTPTPSYGPPYFRGDVIGCGYRPRTGTVFFTRNGKKLEDITHTLKTQNLFPTVGASGPCTVHVNFGQSGFVFIEANVKKWGLAPMTGSLAPPPPYGSEQGSILLEGGQYGVQEGQGWGWGGGSRSRSATARTGRHDEVRSPGPQRSPTDISLAQLSIIDSDENRTEYFQDVGEGTSATGMPPGSLQRNVINVNADGEGLGITAAQALRLAQVDETAGPPPPEYESPSDGEGTIESGRGRRRHDEYEDARSVSAIPRPATALRDFYDVDEETSRLAEYRDVLEDQEDEHGGDEDRGASPPIPSYDETVRSAPGHER